MICLIDGDVIAYRAAFSLQKRKYLNTVRSYTRAEYIDILTLSNPEISKQEIEDRLASTPQTLEVASVNKVYPRVFNILDEVINASKSCRYKIYLSPEDSASNFRVKIDATYKSNRALKEKPVYYNKCREILRSVYGAEVSKDNEADDLIGIQMTTPEIDFNNFPVWESLRTTTADNSKLICCSIDKDLLQIPGKHFDMDKKTFTTVVEPGNLRLANKSLLGTGTLFFLAQMIMGDSCDFIKGVKRYGAKKAFDSLFDTYSISDAYAKVKNIYYENACEESFNTNANLLWIQRYGAEVCPYLLQ